MIETLRYAFQGTYTVRVASTFIDLLGQLWFYVATGVLLVAFLKLRFPRALVPERLGRKGWVPVLLSVVLGAVSPIGTYALIPLIATLLRTGTFPVAPLMGFLIASPLINPLLFMLTLGAFGPGMAVLRLAAAVVLGLSGAWLAHRLWKDGVPAGPAQAPLTAPTREPRLLTPRNFLLEVRKEGAFIGRVFLLSVLVAALTTVLIPADWVARILGGHPGLSVFIAVLAGVPLYACGGGTIPVMEALMNMGMSKGAILAFFISGPATKFSTLAALFACMPKKVVALYLGVTLTGAFLFGIIYNRF
ncbi:MAG: permease [Fibrobacterota bacterium]